MLGEKWPLIYFDPRAEQFQIQYVDTGIKLDLDATLNGQGTVDVSVRTETSSVLDVTSHGELTTYPANNVFAPQARFQGLDFSESMILARLSGASASRFLKTEGLASTPANLVYTLKLELLK